MAALSRTFQLPADAVELIPAIDGDHNVGWIWSADVLPPPGEEHVDVVTVYADDLTTVLGRIFP